MVSRGHLSWIASIACLAIACGDESVHPDAVRERIGPDGGSISSHDGVLTIVLPAGALEDVVEVEIFPSSEPPYVFGPAYRVRPDLDLNENADVTYQRILPANPDNASVGAIRRSDYFDGEGRWSELPRVSIDVEAQSITASDGELSLFYALLEVDAAPPPSTTGSGSGDEVSTATPADTQATTDVLESSSGAADSSSTSSTGRDDGTDTSTSTTKADTDSTEGESSDEGSTTGGDVPIACGDGVPAPGELCYAPGEEFAVGMAPSDLALGDFDGDGAVDVAASNRGSSDISVLLGFGDGTFELPLTYPAGAAPCAIGVGDFDRDQNLDLVVANTDDDTVGLLLGLGDGTFMPQVAYGVGDGPSDLAVASYGVSPASDLVVVSAGSATIQILVGSATGALTPSSPFAVLPEAATAVVAGEYNSDVLNDAFVFGNQGGFHGRAGNGAGSFTPGLEINGIYGGDFPRAASGDLDGNGTTDVVLVDASTNTLHVRSGDGEAHFDLVAQPQAGVDPSDVAVADLSSTGLQAAVVTGRASGDVTILRQLAMNQWMLEDVVPVNAAPSAVQIGEVTGDGVLDIVVCNEGASTISVIASDP